MTKLNIQVHHSDITGKFHLYIWTGDKNWYMADDKDVLHKSSSYSPRRINKRRDKQETKWTTRLGLRDSACVSYSKQV